MLPELTANRRYLAPGGRVDIVAHRLGDILVREGLIEQSPDIVNLCTRDYLPGSLS